MDEVFGRPESDPWDIPKSIIDRYKAGRHPPSYSDRIHCRASNFGTVACSTSIEGFDLDIPCWAPGENEALTLPSPCEYCNNKSLIVDGRGNCISCGAP